MTVEATPAPRSLFVTGTDTGAGKTMIATALLQGFASRGLRAVGMKPVASGTRREFHVHPNEDVEALIEASNVSAPLDLVNPYCFEPAIAPHLAAEQAHRSISVEHIRRCHASLAGMADRVVVEGAGGFLVPLGEGADWGDVALALRTPTILVVGMRLGCLNHALLTAEALQHRKLPLAGWVANRVDPDMRLFAENVETLRRMLAAPLLGIMPHAPARDAARGAIDLEPLLLDA
ncbi:MAG TPA: dethiobiotin synthase [Burkholderiales bacterium]|nr:dethiobiotin synthase [Burkholderiales bacterium]